MTVVLGGDDACSSLVEDLYTAVFPVFSECLSRMSIAILHRDSIGMFIVNTPSIDLLNKSLTDSHF